MSVLRYFARNSLVRLLAFGISVVATFVITPHMLRCLGKVNYGAWAFVSSLSIYYLMLDFGMLQALIKYMSGLHEKGSREERNILFTNACCINILACLLVLVGGAIVSLFIGEMTQHEVSARLLLLCLGLFTASMAFQLLCRTFYGLLVAQMRWTLLAVLYMLKTLAVSAAIFYTTSATAAADDNLVSVAVIVSAGNVLESLSTLFFSLRSENLRFALSFLRLAEVKKLLRFGFPVLIVSLGDFLRSNVQIFIVSALLGLAQTAIFSLARQFINYTNSIMQNVFGILNPYFSRLEARKDDEGIRHSLLQALKLSYGTSTYLGLCLAFYSNLFLTRWLGPQFSEVHGVLLPMALSSILALGQYPANGYLYGVGRHSIIAVLGIGEGVFNVITCVPAMLLYGLPGIGWALLAGTILTRFILLPTRVCSVSGISPGRYYLVITSAIMPQILGQGLFFWVLQPFLQPEYPYLIAACAGQALITAGVFCATQWCSSKLPQWPGVFRKKSTSPKPHDLEIHQ